MDLVVNLKQCFPFLTHHVVDEGGGAWRDTSATGLSHT